MGGNNYLYNELSYRLVGIGMEVHREYKCGHNERIYQKALEEKLGKNNVNFVSKARIKIFSKDSGKMIGYYEPDLIVEDKILVELKAMPLNLEKFNIQLLEYLKTSRYEIGYLFNFGLPSLYYKRLICTNDKKLYLKNLC